MNALLGALQDSPLGELVRGAGVWSYGILNAVHVIGLAALFGAIVVLDLRLLAWRADRPLHEVAAGTVPIAAIGLAVAAVTGLAMLSSNARDYVRNPFLLVKFAALAVGLLNLLLLHRSRAWRAVRERRDASSGDRRRLAMGGALSLVAWIATIVAGRLMGYA